MKQEDTLRRDPLNAPLVNQGNTPTLFQPKPVKIAKKASTLIRTRPHAQTAT